MSYDQKCLDLARYFLPRGSSERLTTGLAQTIQDAVEDFCVGAAVNINANLQIDCPHAAPFRYCAVCPVSPCPIGLGQNNTEARP